MVISFYVLDLASRLLIEKRRGRCHRYPAKGVLTRLYTNGDMHAVLEIVIEQDRQPVAVIKPPQFRGREIDECIALHEVPGSQAIPDEDLTNDMQAAIDAHREPRDPPSWD
jgi:hypothetical protein